MASPKTFGPDTKNYFSVSLYKGIENVIPRVYLEEDYNLSGSYIDPIDQLLNTHLVLANNISSIIYISAIANTVYSSLPSISGIANYFVIQNDLTEITPDNFEKKVLIPLGKGFKDFDSSSSFNSYLSSTFIPGIRLNYPTLSFNGQSNTHRFLIENLSWMYFLNTSAHGNLAFDASSSVLGLLNTLYTGRSIRLDDSIKVLEEFLWKNYATCAAYANLKLIPTDYLPPAYVQTSSNFQFVSGTQQLEKLQTLSEILYSPLFIDKRNFKVRDAFENYISTTTKISATTLKGPFSRLLKAFSYAFADVSEETDKLSILYDLEQCPDELLPELAELIGWRLFGFDPNRWRLQLVNAVDIYKKTGTKASLQLAVDSLFSEDVFNLESLIEELWESYIPNLIYYSLATESSALNNFDSWTRTLSTRLGVNGYSTSSMDENIKLATDSIIFTLVREYPNQFSLGGKPFPVGDPKFVFNYRGRNIQIPPWEEYPYYANADFTDELIDRLADLLVCYGVRESFALQVRDYILQNTLLANDDLRIGNGWLFFTSSVQVPSNWDYVLKRISDKRTEALDYWSNKSSHFKLTLNSSDFDFTKATFDSDSFHAVREISRVVREFSPAHAIPEIQVIASATDTFIPIDFSSVNLGRKINDGYFTNPLGGDYQRLFANAELSAISTRNLYPSATFSRSFADSMLDAPFSGTTTIVRHRNAFIRRNFRFGLNQCDFYTRDGFNMPISWETSTLERSMASSLGFLPLGYIPSAGRFMPIASYSSIPDIYQYCVNQNTSAVFSGVPASSTFPCRGITPLGSGIDYYVDRDQIPPIYGVMHDLKERSKYLLAEKTLDFQLSTLQKDFYWKNVYVSYANSATEASNSEFPSSKEDYLQFKFGRGPTQLYTDYYTYFSGHGLNPRKFVENGPNIFAHTYGSIYENSDFHNKSSYLIENPEYEASSINEIIYLDRSNVFSPGFEGTTLATDNNSLIVSSDSPNGVTLTEYRNSIFYSGVELVMNNVSPTNNHFAYVKIAPVTNRVQNSYFVDNTMLLMRNIGTLPRVRYRMKDIFYDPDQGEDRIINNNFLIPDHEFKLKVKSLALNNTGDIFGGVDLGVWIHTGVEQNQCWVYTRNNKWEQVHTSSITQGNVVNKWSHIYKFPLESRNLDSSSGIRRLNCLNLVFGSDRSNPLLTVTEQDFKTFEVNFNTCNMQQQLTPDYARAYGQLHRLSQDYIVEVFMLPKTENKDKILILDHIDLVDMTLNNKAKFKVDWGTYTGRPFNTYCPVKSVPVTEEQLLTILTEIKYYSIAHASRAYEDTVPQIGDFRKRGRLNYRVDPNWIGTRTADFTNYNTLLLNN